MATPWADDTDSEDEALAVKPGSLTSGLVEADGPVIVQDPKEVVNALMIYGINSKMGGNDSSWIARNGLLRAPVGLEGSSYAGCESRSTAIENTVIPSSSTEERSLLADVVEIDGATKSYSEDGMIEGNVERTELDLGEHVGDAEKMNPDEIDLA